MKLAVIGAGSTRLPLMLGSIAVASDRLRLDEVALYDIRPERVTALLPVGLALASECGHLPPVRIHRTPESCLEGAGAVILTVRPGFEEARARDERACLELGVIGQETTGPAGLAFAFRSVPVVATYARLATLSNPLCLVAIFTNPAGLVTQAMVELGFTNAVGVCDSADHAVKAVSGHAGLAAAACDFDVYGLNHLSWTRAVRDAAGRDLLRQALQDDAMLARCFPMFEPSLLRSLGRIPVEYLWYYLWPDQALAAMLDEPWTRGEALLEANRRMLGDVGRLVDQGRVLPAVSVYADWLLARSGSYMKYARTDASSPATRPAPPTASEAIAALKEHVGGYAGVAMDLLAARSGAGRRPLVLNVPNRGAIPGLDDGDVVECDCDVDETGVAPRAHRDLPEEDMALVRRVKEYERLATRAVLERSSSLAEDALAAHPLVPGREVASRLVAALGLGR